MKKNILITGSTDGIGKLTAIQLAKDGHNLYVHGRNAEKLENVIIEVKNLSSNDNIIGFVADFSDLKAVQKMGAKINKEVFNLDVLINNAGIFKSTVDFTSKGLDIRFAVNYFAPFILTEILLPLLAKSGESRIINLSSAAQTSVSLEALNGKQEVSVNESYAQSKLALTMWSFDLSNHITNTTVIAVNPGSLLNTRMAIEAYGQHWAPAEKGSNILVDLAISDEYKGVSGKYFDNDMGEDKGYFSEAHLDAYSQEKIDALIENTKTIVEQLSV